MRLTLHDRHTSAAADVDEVQEARSAGSHGATLLSLARLPGHYHRPASDDFMLQLVTAGCGSGRVDHGVRFDCMARPGRLAISPCDTDLAYAVDHEMTFLAAMLPRDPLKRAIERRTGRSWSGDFGALHGKAFEHPAVGALMLTLWDEAASGSAHGALYADSAWETVALALLATSGALLIPAPPVRGRLAGWQERKVTEYLRGHMAEDVTLAALAEVAGLSTFHFARAFKQSTGLPPHGYLRRLRLERARELLVGTNLSVGDIAEQVGYETPQALARMFRAEAGESPLEYRRERRS